MIKDSSAYSKVFGTYLLRLIVLMVTAMMLIGCDTNTKQSGQDQFANQPSDVDNIDSLYAQDAPPPATMGLLPSETLDVFEDKNDSEIILQDETSPDEPNLYSTKKNNNAPTAEKSAIDETIDVPLADEQQVKQSLKTRRHYKKQFRMLHKTIAIVIDDIGVDQNRSMHAANLDGV